MAKFRRYCDFRYTCSKPSASRNLKSTFPHVPETRSESFDLVYAGSDGKEHRPYMIHRALLGSWERFFGLLIEHYAGAFPLWLSPVQVKVIPVADRHLDYARKLEKELG